MPERDKIAIVAREWVAKAENDLKNAIHTLTLGVECPTDTVCFHAQQCVEKYVKSLLVMFQVAFSRTHDIETLTLLLPPELRPSLTVEQQRRFTEYATVMRYPGSYEPVTLSEAAGAVDLAQQVRSQIREYLEDASLF